VDAAHGPASQYLENRVLIIFGRSLFAENLEGVVAQFLGIAFARPGNFDDERDNRLLSAASTAAVNCSISLGSNESP
jgi:hypothetical protein